MPGSTVVMAGELIWLRDCRDTIVSALADLCTQYPEDYLRDCAVSAFVDAIAREIPDSLLRNVVHRIAATAARTLTHRKAA